MARSFETLISPLAGHMLGRAGHLGLGQREVAATPDAQSCGLYRGQGGWRADERLRVDDGPEVVEPRGKRRIRFYIGDHPIFVRVTEQGPEVGPLVRGE